MGTCSISGGGKPKKLPNYKKAEIAQRKLKNYLLNPNGKSPSKAKFFRGLGYNMKNYRRLESDIRRGISENKAIAVIPNKYGHDVKVYNVSMPLGINKSVMVLTDWQIDRGSSIPRFITAYPDNKKR